MANIRLFYPGTNYNPLKAPSCWQRTYLFQMTTIATFLYIFLINISGQLLYNSNLSADNYFQNDLKLS